MFPKFSYSNAKLQDFGAPINILGKALDEREKRAEYVIDATEKYKQALASMPVTAADQPKLKEAQDYLGNVVGEYAEGESYADKYLDTKRLASDLESRFGLSAMQQQYKQQQAYITDLKERYKQGDISAGDMDRAIAETQYLNRKGVEKGEAGWRSTFSGRRVLNKFDAAKEAEDFIKGIKASTIIDPDTGATYHYSQDVQGYINADTGDAVSADRVASAARGYLMQNPDFLDKVQDDVYYELNAMLRDPETGRRRDMTAEDFQALTGVSVSKALGDEFGGKSIEELQEEGVDLETLYGRLRAEKEVNNAIAPVVGKNAYAQLRRTHLTDFVFRHGLTNSGKDKTDPVVAHSYLEAFHTEDRYNSEDLALAGQNRVQAQDRIKFIEENIDNVDSLDPETGKSYKQELIDLRDVVERTTENIDKVLEYSPTAQKLITKAVQNEGEPYDVSLNSGSIDGLDINKGQMMDLVNIAMSRDLEYEDLSPFIGLEEDTQEGALMEDTPKANAISALKHKVERVASEIEDNIEDEDIVYNRTYHYLNLNELSAEERRSNSYHQLVRQVKNIPEQSSNFHTTFKPVGDGRALAESIADEFNVEDGDTIQWDKAVITPLFDNRKDEDGNYKPLYGIKVPIKRKDKDSEEAKMATVTAHGSDPNRDARYIDAMQDLYRKYRSIPNPNATQTNVLEGLAVNLFNLTPAGREFDMYDLRGAKNRQVFDIPLDDEGLRADIQVFTKGSPDNKKYYLIEPNKKDRMGNHMFYAANQYGDISTYTAAQIQSSSDLTSIGANTPTGLKKQIANMWAQTRPQYRVDTSQLVDAKGIFGNDIKDESVDTRVTPKAADSLRIMKSRYSDLILTDGLREEGVSYGAKDSIHKEANAVDLRDTPGARELAQESPESLNSMGIEEISFHNNHFHVVFK